MVFEKLSYIEGKNELFTYSSLPNIFFSPDNTALYATNKDNSIIELEIKTGKIKGTILPSGSHNERITIFTISNDDKYLLTSEFEDLLKLWDKNSGKLLNEFYCGDWILDISISPNNKYVVALGEGEFNYIWDLSSGDLHREIKCFCQSHTISPDDQYFICSNRDSEIVIFRIEDGKIIRKLKGHESSVFYVAITPDGDKIVSVSDDNTIKVWDIKSERVLQEIKVYDYKTEDDFIAYAILSPDGNNISVPTDDFLKIWDITTGVLIQDLPFKYSYITGSVSFSLTYSRDGVYLAMADGKDIFIWEKK